MTVLRLFRRRRPEAAVFPVRPCQAYRPLGPAYDQWGDVRCNLAYGHHCAHAHCTDHGIKHVWLRGLDRGEVMS